MNEIAALSMPDRTALAAQYRAVRALTDALVAPLSPEDRQAQSMPDASPAKWHRAHTTWFFETFVLAHLPGYARFDEQYGYLFNSYYEAVGPRHARPNRGLLSRPADADVTAYRAHVDAAVGRLIETVPALIFADVSPLIALGLHHEQQHQELLLTDIKHLFGSNPLAPSYAALPPRLNRDAPALKFVAIAGGRHEIGHSGDGFAFDNEGPRHSTLIPDFSLASRPVTNGEYLEFINDGGYRNAGLWHADGWATVQAEGWRAPLYWRERDAWREFTLHGLAPLDPAAPVTHVSFYEASAYAAWANARLPTEAEWEIAATQSLSGDIEAGANLLSSGRLHPVASANGAACAQLIGDVWEWTGSAYLPYPGFRAPKGAIGEYNGKFMVNQMVLRGGSCATPPGHIRTTYRNFFYPQQRWQFTGIRLAQDA